MSAPTREARRERDRRERGNDLCPHCAQTGATSDTSSAYVRHDAECPYSTPVPASWRRYGG